MMSILFNLPRVAIGGLRCALRLSTLPLLGPTGAPRLISARYDFLRRSRRPCFHSICGFGATPPPAAVAVRKVGVFMLSR